MNKKDQKRGGFYWFDGKPYLSVTNILKVIDKSGPLTRWFGKEVYLQMVKDPTLSEQEALSAPYKLTEKAINRGKTIHSIVEAYKQTGAVIDSIPENYKGYATAFYKWISDQNIEILENEKTVLSNVHKYAGTCDLVVMNKQTGDIWIVDVKTGKDIYLEAHLQVSAYKYAFVEHGEEVDKTGILLLQDNGNYKFEEVEDHHEVFLHAKAIWEFLNQDTCKKLGYK